MSGTDRLSDLIRSLKEVVGSVPSLDKLIAQVEVTSIKGKKYVVKRFTKEVGVIKWIPPTIVFRAAYPFTLLPKERFTREVNFFSQEWECVKTPKILEADEESLTIIREFVEGEFISYDRHANDLARALAKIHSRNWALGDVKPTNFLISAKGELYVIDAEQAIKTDNVPHKAWDLMLTSFFSAYYFITDTESYGGFLRKFLKAYLMNGDNRNVLRELTGLKFGGLILLMPLPHAFTLSDVLEEMISK